MLIKNDNEIDAEYDWLLVDNESLRNVDNFEEILNIVPAKGVLLQN